MRTIWFTRSILVLLFIVGLDAAANAQSVCREPLRKVVWKSLDQDLRSGPWNCANVLDAKPIKLGKLKAFIIRGHGQPLCGATGNCSTWIVARIGQSYQKLLYAGSVIEHYDVHRLSTTDTPELTFWGRMGASDHYLGTYRFNGRKYLLKKCIYRFVNTDGKISLNKADNSFCG